MKNRTELARLFNTQGFSIGAEIGVFNGHFAQILCAEIPNLRLFAVDCWETYPEYKDHTRESTMSKAYAEACDKLSKYNCTFIKRMSADAVAEFRDGSLDFVFIDGNHSYEYVKQDIEEWTKKVRKGGIVAGHDYCVLPHFGMDVVRAVNEYVDTHGYELHITRWDVQASVEDDRQPCWYFYV